MNYIIETGIKPKEARAKSRTDKRVKYPFSNMRVGDSFAFMLHEKTKVDMAARYHNNKGSKRFVLKEGRDDKPRVFRLN